MKIAICASFSFYEHVAHLEDELLALGHTPLIPETAKAMKAAGDYRKEPPRNKTGRFLYQTQKTNAMRAHFDEIGQADAILVVNDQKHGQADYIGPNVLMEMAVAFALRKAIYLFNDIPLTSSFLDEIVGLQPKALRQNLSLLQSVA